MDRKSEKGRPRAVIVNNDRYLSIRARRKKGAVASQLSCDFFAPQEGKFPGLCFQSAS